MRQELRNCVESFRMTPSERRELSLLARAEQLSKSEAIRRAIRHLADGITKARSVEGRTKTRDRTE